MAKFRIEFTNETATEVEAQDIASDLLDARGGGLDHFVLLKEGGDVAFVAPRANVLFIKRIELHGRVSAPQVERGTVYPNSILLCSTDK